MSVEVNKITHTYNGVDIPHSLYHELWSAQDLDAFLEGIDFALKSKGNESYEATLTEWVTDPPSNVNLLTITPHANSCFDEYAFPYLHRVSGTNQWYFNNSITPDNDHFTSTPSTLQKLGKGAFKGDLVREVR